MLIEVTVENVRRSTRARAYTFTEKGIPKLGANALNLYNVHPPLLLLLYLL